MLSLIVRLYNHWQAAEGHIHVQGLAIANELVVQQAVRCFTKTILLIIESPCTGIFILFLIFHMSSHSSYLRFGWIFYIIYYVSRLFLMNLGDSFGISIFVDESSRFAPKISASHFFMVSERWNCLGSGVLTIKKL